MEVIQVIFDTAPSGIFIYSLDRRLAECNRAACEMHGYSKEAMLGMAPQDFIHPDGYQTFIDFQKELEANGFFRGESCGLTADGGKFDVQVFGQPVMINGTGYLYSVIRDITEGRRQTSGRGHHDGAGLHRDRFGGRALIQRSPFQTCAGEQRDGRSC